MLITQQFVEDLSRSITEHDRNDNVVSLLENQTKRFLSRNIVMLFLKALAFSASDEQNSPKCRFLCYRLTKRFEQFCGIDAKYRSLHSISILRICLFLETKAWPHSQHSNQYFKKNLFGIARTCFISTDGTLLVFSKSKVPILKDTQGTYEKVRTTLRLPFLLNEQATVVAHGVNRSCDEKELAICTRKIEIARMLQGKRGVVQLIHDFCTPHTTKDGITIEKINMLWELYEGNLDLFRTRQRPLSFRQLLHFTENILEGLTEMHDLQIIHGDLKATNLLFRQIGYRLEAALCDFGFSFIVGQHQPNHVLLDGFYGSIVYTAPELFGNPAFTGDFFKVEIFALGALLYQFFTGNDPNWFTFLHSCYIQPAGITLRQQLLFQQLIRADITFALQKLVVETEENRFYHLLLQMMHPNPAFRPTALQCLNYVRSLLPSDELST